MANKRLRSSGWGATIQFSCICILLFATSALLAACTSKPEPQRDTQPQHEMKQPADTSESAVHVPRIGICDRHEHIRGEILWWLGKDDCADVSDEDLASINGTLHLNDHYTFTSLDAGDLRELSSLRGLFMGNESLNLTTRYDFCTLITSGRQSNDQQEPRRNHHHPTGGDVPD